MNRILFYFKLILFLFVIGCKGLKRNQFLAQKYEVRTIALQKDRSLGPCEPNIAINPVDHNNIVVGSVLDNVHVSKDGGETWMHQKLTSKFGVWGDPVLVTDSKGYFYYFHLSDPEGTHWGSEQILDRIVVQKSEDGGITWSEGIGIGLNVPKQQDKPWVCVNPKTDEIYVTWTEFDQYGSSNPDCKSRLLFSKSKDGAVTWSVPVQISSLEGDCIDDDNTVEGVFPISDGENLYVTWGYGNKIWFSKSRDNGCTWSKETTIGEQSQGWSFEISNLKRVNAFPSLALDGKKQLHVSWGAANANNLVNLVCVSSKDEGSHWSSPKVIKPFEGHQFFNQWVCNPRENTFYSILYEQEILGRNEIQVAILKHKLSNPRIEVMYPSTLFSTLGSNFFGDYNDIEFINGNIYGVWTEVENGKNMLKFLKIIK